MANAGTSMVYQRLARCGIRPAAERLKDEIRLRRKAAGDGREKAATEAHREMWEQFRPIVERLEAGSSTGQAPTLAGLPTNTDSSLDPNYNEPDRGKQLRDGLLWAVMEFQRVIRDTDSGPVANIEAANTPPPNAYALFVLSTYALSPIEKRRDLIGRSLPFASKAHDEVAATDSSDDGAFLHELVEGWEEQSQ